MENLKNSILNNPALSPDEIKNLADLLEKKTRLSPQEKQNMINQLLNNKTSKQENVDNNEPVDLKKKLQDMRRNFKSGRTSKYVINNNLKKSLDKQMKNAKVDEKQEEVKQEEVKQDNREQKEEKDDDEIEDFVVV